MVIDRIAGKVAPVIKGTPLYSPAKYAYNKARPRIDTLENRILDFYVSGQLSSTGFHTVNPPEPEISPFQIWLLGGDKLQRARMKGQLEPEVMSVLSSHIDEDSVFWEVGAAWGYFSMAMSTVTKEVVAFEIMHERTEKIRMSADRNGFDHIEVVEGTVGGEIELDDYPKPDIVLIDIEGWEYEALRNAPELIEHRPTMVIEIHESPSSTPGNPEINPEGIYEILRDARYTISRIRERDESNYHIVAKPG
jgi:hypothetical protein